MSITRSIPSALLALAFGLAATLPLCAQNGDSQVLYSSTLWKKGKHAIEGTYRIESTKKGGTSALSLVLNEAFKTKKAPDLKIVLSSKSVDQAKNDNALEGGVIVSLLESNQGAQKFGLPLGIDLSSFRSVLIHCEQYTKLWGAAPLGLPE